MNRVIPCVLMRAGTSRGPFFLRDWLPQDQAARDEALIGAIGASDLLQVDGVGGGSTLTSKVAIVSKSAQPGCDVDYLFAQVGVGQKSVDTRPNCGNMLSGVAPFAIEQGLVSAQDGETTVRVFNVNTHSRIDVTVSSLGDATSLAGGSLVLTPLIAADNLIYAVAQGPLAVTGFASQGKAESITQGVPTTGRIPNGGLIEREGPGRFADEKVMVLELRNPDFNTAVSVADVINAHTHQRYGIRVAREDDLRTVTLHRTSRTSS